MAELQADNKGILTLQLTVSKSGVGRVVGLAPTVAVRHGTDYLDWSDLAFKSFGWVQKFGPLTDLGNGTYQRTLNLASYGFATGDVLTGEYDVSVAGQPNFCTDVFVLTDTLARIDFLRKMATNRLEQFPGTPGTMILWDDDNVTPLKNWSLRDTAGGGINAATGSPAKRSAAT